MADASWDRMFHRLVRMVSIDELPVPIAIVKLATAEAVCIELDTAADAAVWARYLDPRAPVPTTAAVRTTRDYLGWTVVLRGRPRRSAPAGVVLAAIGNHDTAARGLSRS
jgi:hypothetical protein